MKDTLLKIALTATFSLSTIPGWSQAFSCLNVAASVKLTQALRISKKTKHFSHFLAMGTQQNLKAYHLGLKALFPQHHIPSSQNLLGSIRSYSKFFGLLTKLEALERFKLGNAPFFIFEEKNRKEAHFYIVHSRGLRHFTVNKMEIAGIDNGDDMCYPCLIHLLQSTAVL